MKLRYLVALACLAPIACSSGGGGGGNGGGGTPTPTGPPGTPTFTQTPDPNATDTPTPPVVAGSALFVRADAGDDGNDGRDPANAFRTISAALAALPSLSSGRTVVVGPGTYNERIADLPRGESSQPVVLFADPSGASTQDSPAAVVLQASGDGSMIQVDENQFVEIDGFVIRGGSGGNNAGVDIRSSSNVTVRNCEISGTSSQADGIAVINSNEILLINNLVYDNARRGVRVAGGGAGSRLVRLINNTITDNEGQGLVVGSTETGSEVEILFNIFQNNIGPQGLQILVTEPSLELFASDTNLVFPGRYEPEDLPQDFDILEDALFVDPIDSVYLLSDAAAGQSATSPAVDSGFQDVFPEDILDELELIKARTTSTSGEPDTGELDLGYHAPVGSGGPIPVERTFYVRESGDDERSSGRSPEDAFRSIRRALNVATGGDTIIVGPGAYAGRLLIQEQASAEAPLTLRADPTGELTEDAPGIVGVDSSGRDTGFRLIGASWVIIDGFTILGATASGVEVRSGASNVTVRNCFIDSFGELLDGEGDGITVDDSEDISLINNVLSFNDGNGIQVRRSERTRIINNTVAENGVRGIRVGSGSVAAPNTLLQNNIVYFSGTTAVDFNMASAETAELSHNLVFPADYRPPSEVDLPRPNDINEDARFVGFTDFRLDSDSPARNAADPDTDSAIRADLSTRTTSADDSPDSGALDMGYHYPIIGAGGEG